MNLTTIVILVLIGMMAGVFRGIFGVGVAEADLFETSRCCGLDSCI